MSDTASEQPMTATAIVTVALPAASTLTRVQLDVDVDNHVRCPWCYAALQLHPRGEGGTSTTAAPYRTCASCDFWRAVREGEPGWTSQPTCKVCVLAVYGTSAAHVTADGRYIHSACEPPRRVLFGVDRLRERRRAHRQAAATEQLARAIDRALIDFRFETGDPTCAHVDFVDAVHNGGVLDQARVDALFADGSIGPDTADAYRAVLAATWDQLHAAVAHLTVPR